MPRHPLSTSLKISSDFDLNEHGDLLLRVCGLRESGIGISPKEYLRIEVSLKATCGEDYYFEVVPLGTKNLIPVAFEQLESESYVLLLNPTERTWVLHNNDPVGVLRVLPRTRLIIEKTP